MPIPTFTKLGPDPSFSDLVNKVNTVVGELTNLILNLDSLNVVSLTADHVDTGTLDAGLVTIRSDLTAGAFIEIDGSGMRVNNGLFDTFTVDIDGAVTMTAATVRSTVSAYPRIVMDSANNIFSAETSSTENIQIVAEYFLADSPSIVWNNGVDETNLGYQPLLGFTMLSDDQISIGTNRDLFINVDNVDMSSSNQVTLSDFSQLFSNGDSQTLQQALDEKSTAGVDTDSFSGGSHNHGIPSGIQLATSSDGVTIDGNITWVSYGGFTHSHTQT